MIHPPLLSTTTIMIKAMFWNVRGVDNALTIARLRKLKRMHQVSLLAMCEPKAGRERLDFIRNRLGFRHAISNDESRIWVMYGQDYRCDLLVASRQFLALEVTHAVFRCSVVAVFVHTSCASLDREVLWQQLGEVCPQGMPAIFFRGF